MSRSAIRTFLLVALVVAAGSSGARVASAGTPGGGGTAVTGADKAAVQAAIAKLTNTAAAKLLTALLKDGKICKRAAPVPNPNNNVAWSHPTCRDTWDGSGGIDLTPDALALSAVELAALLFHELLHYTWHRFDTAFGGPTSYDELHCQIYYEEYVFLRHICDSTTASAADKAAACKRAASIDGWYAGTFKTFYDSPGGAGGPNWPPPPPGGFPHWASMRGIPIFNDVPTTERYRGYYGTSFVGGPKLLIDYDDAQTGTVSHTEISTAIDRVRDICHYRTGAGVDVVLAVGTSTDGSQGKVSVIVDSDADRVVDTVLRSFSGSYLVSPNGVMTLYQPNGTFSGAFVMDSSTSRIWRLADTDADQLPDSLGSLFADSQLTPLISSAKSMRPDGAYNSSGQPTGTWSISICSEDAQWDVPELLAWHVVIADSNADGVGDSASSQSFGTPRGPALWDGGCVGDNNWNVWGWLGSSITVFKENPTTGLFDIASGTGVVGSDNLATIAVSAMSVGTRYILTDTTLSMSSLPGEVSLTIPQMRSISPAIGPSVGGTTLTIMGRNFPPSPTVTFDCYSPGAEFVSSVAATVVSASATHIIVSTPANPVGTSARSFAEIRIGGSGVSADDEARFWFFLYGP